VLASGAALADDSFGASPLYNGQYAYNTSPSYYGTYPTYYSTYPGYAYYYGSNYPGYGWYPGGACLRPGSDGALASLFSFKPALGSLRRMALTSY